MILQVLTSLGALISINYQSDLPSDHPTLRYSSVYDQIYQRCQQLQVEMYFRLRKTKYRIAFIKNCKNNNRHYKFTVEIRPKMFQSSGLGVLSHISKREDSSSSMVFLDKRLQIKKR